MSKYTPGPWKAVLRKKYSIWQVYPEGAVIGKPGWIADGIDQGDNADANARLIAAAPDLLEALEAMLYHFDLGMGNMADEIPAIDAARAAIRKATEDTKE